MAVLGFAGAFGGGSSSATANGDVPKSTAFGPISPAVLAKVAWLRKIIVVEITELCVCGVTSGAFELLMLGKVRGL